MKTVNHVVTVHHHEMPLHLYYSHPEEGSSFPTVVIFPTWAGQDLFCQHKAHLMAQKGYLAVVADLYGYGRQGQTPEECSDLMTPFVKDRELLKDRMLHIVQHLNGDPLVDKNNRVAMGYCFGGLCVLDAVRNNMGFKGGISIHGLYMKPDYALPSPYDAQLLVLHGYKDPMNVPSQLAEFQEELGASCADWQVVSFGLGMHAFTNPNAMDPQRGTVYDPCLDKRTTQYVDMFLRELFV